ncbi:MAG: hypothetical protein U0X40_07630 [Ferruginibacter sp.]
MVQMAPNSALIKAVVMAVEDYPRQGGFSIISLRVNSATPLKSSLFLFDKKDDKTIRALISNPRMKELGIKPKTTISGEFRKMDPDLWRAVENSIALG